MSTAMVHVDPARQAWLEQRRHGIGASDVAVILGLSTFKSPYALWAEKTGMAAEPDESQEHLRWGLLLEPAIADEYSAQTGRRLIDHGRYAVRQHPSEPLLCTLDREIEPIDDRGPGSLEIKTGSAFQSSDWDDELPLRVQVQLQAQLAVTGWSWGSIAVLVGGNSFRHVDVRRNDAFINEVLLPRCRDFWRRVESMEAPEVDGSEHTARTIALLYPKESGETVALPAEAAEWDRAYVDAAAAEKAAKARKDEASNRIKAAIGAASFGQMPDGTLWSLSTTERAGYVVEPTTFRSLRRKTRKAGSTP
jgi:putative phage-type endonuclease